MRWKRRQSGRAMKGRAGEDGKGARSFDCGQEAAGMRGGRAAGSRDEEDRREKKERVATGVFFLLFFFFFFRRDAKRALLTGALYTLPPLRPAWLHRTGRGCVCREGRAAVEWPTELWCARGLSLPLGLWGIGTVM